MDSEKLFERLDDLLDRIELIMPAEKPTNQDWSFHAYRWSNKQLQGVSEYHVVDESQLLYIKRQADLLRKNTRQFMLGHPANNALLWGARGTGKSSIIKAQLQQFKDDGLCMVEVSKKETENLFEIITHLSLNKRKYIIYMDDLSFEADDESYKALKATLEGSIQAQPANVLIYATSNRRHLMPESMQDNLSSTMEDGQLHPSDAIEEKISLSDRFGLWLSFYPFSQQQYLGVAEQSLKRFKLKLDDKATKAALQFATQRGSRSGRIAHQFATYWLGETLE
ncbi:MAG: ATP-binding protein [Gammaproteobacteria bacterium]|nr:ATP-binding protein [Gammaproteobacteria bacterium]MBL7000515.1 ATP-binding protein [Gammaproteobacteria bacterium]